MTDFHPLTWRRKHQFSREQAGAAIGMTARGWQAMELLWDRRDELVGTNNPYRTEMACKMADILLSKDGKRAAYLAARYWRENNSK